jgi:calcineurin-like phosphoesterase family protein
LIHFTSDTHYGHNNIIRYCDRPFRSVEGMTQAMVQRWNARVAPEDTVYHLGDFSMMLKSGPVEEILARLNGTKILIYGNHDKHWTFTKWKRLGFDDVMLTWDGELSVGHESHRIQMIHNPEDERFNLERKTKIVLCGHVHTAWKTRLQGTVPYVNVGVDMWGYNPITLRQILDYLRTPDVTA